MSLRLIISSVGEILGWLTILFAVVAMVFAVQYRSESVHGMPLFSLMALPNLILLCAGVAIIWASRKMRR